MKAMLMMKILWKRHWWEACLCVLFSLLLSGLIVTETGSKFWNGLVWLEIGSLVLLVARVGLTQSGFGTFGGWKVRPLGRGPYLLVAVLFLIVPMALSAAGRLYAVRESVGPTPEGWREVLWDGSVMLMWFVVLFVFCQTIGRFWDKNEMRSRSRLAWGAIAVLVTAALVPVHDWGKDRFRRSGGGGSAKGIVSDSMDEIADWKVLRSFSWDAVKTNEPFFRRIPLKAGEVSEQDGFRVKIIEVRMFGEAVVVDWEVLRKEDFERERFIEPAVMVSYPSGYFGASMQYSRREKVIRVPLLRRNYGAFRSSFLSPLSLPENQASASELLVGAELWITVGKMVVTEGRDAPIQKADDDAGLREKLASDEFGSETKARLAERGREAIEDVLRAEPWSEAAWEKVVRPYLNQFAGEGDLPRLLELLDLNPWMVDLFFEKSWAQEAEPILREHLKSGKTLTKSAVIYLAGLGEVKMGDDLVNQLLRMDGDFDAVAKALMKHPGVDWDQVRREAWRRMATGFGAHHVRVQWGAEMGEKEALRRFLAEAIQGKKWEREKLEEWFGKEEDVVEEMLRENWEKVVFRDGKWELGR